MVQALQRSLTFDEFLAWYPDDGCIYELIDGRVVLMNPTGPHELVSGFLVKQLNRAIDQANLPYSIPRTATVKPFREQAGYKPDVVILNERSLKDEPRWNKESTIILGSTCKLVIEVASTNWRDDYERKLPDYEEMGIAEYWIVDYLGVAAARHIGKAKLPTISIYGLEDAEYQLQQFRGAERIISSVLPAIELTVDQIMQAGRVME